MSVDIGIIGLARSGKTTVFNLLSGVPAEAAHPTLHTGVTKVPDPRLETLADILHPKKVVPTELKFTDIGAATKGLAEGKGIAGQFLAELSTADALLAVIRAFADESIPHDEGSLDIDRDIAAIDLELIVSDMAIIERRLGRIEESLKGSRPPERQTLLKEQQLLTTTRSALEKDSPLRETALTPEDARLLANFQFLSAKPLLIVVNIGEEQLAQAATLDVELSSRHSRRKGRVIALCGKLEMELSRLDEATAAEFRSDFGMGPPGRVCAIRLAYELLELHSFFSHASDELKVWPVPAGTSAVKAAGKIHSDMERGFIRAEVVGYDDLVQCGSLAEARRKGLLRLEGKNYTVNDGDVITFLFNV